MSGGVLTRARVVLEGDTAALTKALQGAESAMVHAGAKMEGIGKNLSKKITLPLLGVGVAAFKVNEDFHHALAMVEGLVGIQKDIIDDWSDDVKDLAVQYGSTAKAAGEALFFITSAGLRGKDAMDALELSLKGSAAGLGDAKTVADTLTSAMNAYGSANMSATRATEIITAAVREGKLEASSLAPVMGRLLPIASAMGIGFEQIGGLLAVFSRTGAEASEAAVSLQAIMMTLMKPSKQAAEILAGAGLSMASLRDVAAGPNGLINVMRLLNDRFGEDDEALTQIVPNVRAFRGVMNALAQDGTVVDTMLSNVANSTGIVDEAFGAHAQGPAFRLQQAWAAITNSLIAVGDAIMPIVLPALNTFAQITSKLTKALEGLPAPVRLTAVALAMVAATAGPVLFGIGAMLKLAPLMTSSLTLLAGAASAVYVKSVALAGIMMKEVTLSSVLAAAQLRLAGVRVRATAIMTAMELRAKGLALGGLRLASITNVVTAATRALMSSMLTVVAPLALVGGMAIFMYKNWDVLRIQFALAWAAIKNAVFEGVKFILAALDKLIGWIPGVGKVMDGLRESFDEFAEGSLGKSGEQIYQMELDLAGMAKTGKKTTAVIDELAEVIQDIANPKPKIKAVWAEAAVTATAELANSLRAAANMSALLGKSFNLPEAQAEAYKTAIDSMVLAGVDLNAQVGPQGETLHALANRYSALKTQTDAATAAQELLEDQLEKAKSITEAARTPQQIYNQTLAELKTHLDAGRISQDVYTASIAAASKTLEESNPKIAEAKRLTESLRTPMEVYSAAVNGMAELLTSGLITQDTFNRGVIAASDAMDEAGKKSRAAGQWMSSTFDGAGTAVTDFAMGSKDAIGNFVKQAMKDLARLIARALIFKAISLAFPGAGGFFKGLAGGKIPGFAAGGFLPPGQVGMVGERGMELVQAGRQGLTITPMVKAAGGTNTGDLAGEILSRLGPPPAAPTPEAAAVSDYYRRLMSTMVQDAKSRGVRF